jgi:2'-5' RNA ligase
MKGKTHKTAVVLIPPETLWPPIQKIRQKYDHQFRRWMPHITLLYPFWPVSELPYLRDRFSGICDSLNAFQITLKTFHCFQHSKQNCTVWLSPEPADALTDLQTLLWKTFPDCNDVRHFSGGFTPHLSIGQVHGKNSAWHAMLVIVKKNVVVFKRFFYNHLCRNSVIGNIIMEGG